MTLTWEALELPVLRWVLEHGDGGTGCLAFGSTQPFAGIPELTEAQVAEAIRRLTQHGLVTGPGPVVTNAYDRWPRLRPTADGLRVLGEWPPAKAASVNEALALILRSLADRDELDEEEKTATRRAASTVVCTAGEVVLDIAKGELERAITGDTGIHDATSAGRHHRAGRQPNATDAGQEGGGLRHTGESGATDARTGASSEDTP